MTLQVRISSRAALDADAIFDWLAARSPDGAVRWYGVYLATLRSLPDHALGCPIAPEAELLNIDLRQLMFKTRKGNAFRALFVIVSNTIHVVGLRGAGQDFATADDLELPD
jgi:plasmid stabilization system protein ParE